MRDILLVSFAILTAFIAVSPLWAEDEMEKTGDVEAAAPTYDQCLAWQMKEMERAVERLDEAAGRMAEGGASLPAELNKKSSWPATMTMEIPHTASSATITLEQPIGEILGTSPQSAPAEGVAEDPMAAPCRELYGLEAIK